MHFKKPFHFGATLFLLLSVLVIKVNGQQNDSLQGQTIDIYNVFQPKLPEAAKLNLNTSLPNTDNTVPNLIYTLPTQSLKFSYMPISLQPLAIGIDTSKGRLFNNYVKAGIGNRRTALLDLGLSNGNVQPLQYGLNFHYRSAKGALKDQKFTEGNVLLYGKYYSPTHIVKAQVGYDLNGLRYYGYDHQDMTKRPDSIKQNFKTLSAKISIENTEENLLKVNYQPEITFYRFSDKYNRNETSGIFDLPVQKAIVKDIYLSAQLKADLSSFRTSSQTLNNNLVSIHPAVEISKEQFKLHAGVNPTWSKGQFFLLPDIVNETHLIKDRLILSSGWISYFNKNSFQNVANENPFILDFNNPLNTRVEDRYTGIKGSIDNHFTYNTKFAFLNLHDRVLYLNDSIQTSKFDILNESDLKAFELHLELGYALGELFSAKFSSSWYNYHNQKEEDKPWGLQPFQSDIFFQYGGVKNLKLTADVMAMSGSWYKDLNGNAKKTKGAFDLNLGGNYNFGDQFNAWLSLDNLFNNHYERWNNYQSIGLNVSVGILVKF